MASRIDHTNCSHPRTPAGRAACRKDWHRPEGIPGVPVPLTREQLMDGMTTKEKARFARQLANDAARAAGKLAKRTDSKGKAAATKSVPGCTDRNGTCMVNLCLCNDRDGAGTRAANRAKEAMNRADSKVRVVTRVEDLPMPKLTPAQLASPVFRSLMRKREV